MHGDAPFVRQQPAQRHPETMPASCKLLVRLQVPMYSASGLRVQYLRVWEKSNSKVDKWIRKVGVPTSPCDHHGCTCWVAESCQQCDQLWYVGHVAGVQGGRLLDPHMTWSV